MRAFSLRWILEPDKTVRCFAPAHHWPEEEGCGIRTLEGQFMLMYCELSNSRLGLLYVAAMILGADMILFCWRFSDGQSVWPPGLGGVAMLCVSFSVLISAKKREGVV